MKKIMSFCAAMLALGTVTVSGTIVDGVRQMPQYPTSEIVVGQEMYLLNVGSNKFFSQGSSWGTKAIVDDTGRKMKFEASGSDFILYQYNWRTASSSWGPLDKAWRQVFFDSESAIFVDRNRQTNYLWRFESNGNGTYHLMGSPNNPDFGIYDDCYVGLLVGENPNTTDISPFIVEPAGNYVDWACVTIDDYEAMAGLKAIYDKAQELKAIIDKTEALGGDASSVKSVYLNEDATMEELENAIKAANTLYIQALIDSAPDKNNVDVTTMLVNPDFENDEVGWTVEAASGNGPNGHEGNVRPGGSSTNHCYEAWNNSDFNIYQVVDGAPVGVYEIEVQGFYRYGRGNDAWNAYLAQNVEYVKPNGVPVYIYMNNNATNFVNVYGDPKQITNESFYSYGSNDYASQVKNGTTYYFPNGMASAAIAFSDGMYTQSAFGLVAREGDKMQIGVKGNSHQLNDSWCIWDNFRLIYRGFNADVIKPVLQQAMNDVKGYLTMLMGKTEYAALSTAYSNAEKGIDNHDGEAMFHALNALYDAKDPALTSKDIFLAAQADVYAALLDSAVTANEAKHLSAATLQKAKNLSVGIRTNTIYENNTVGRMMGDVEASISEMNASIAIYASMKAAADALNAALVEADGHVPNSLGNEANSALQEANNAYNDGSYTDDVAQQKTTLLYSYAEKVRIAAAHFREIQNGLANLTSAMEQKTSAALHAEAETLKSNILNSIANGYIEDADYESLLPKITEMVKTLGDAAVLYSQFMEAINNLSAAITEAEGETVHVSANCLALAKRQKDKAINDYNDGTIAEANIPSRITSINKLIDNLTNSIHLYQNFATAIDELKAAIEENAGKKMSKAVLDNANATYTGAVNAYESGSVDDDQIEEQIAKLQTAKAELAASVAKYAVLKTAIDELQAAIEAAKAHGNIDGNLMNSAISAQSAANTMYNEGTIADADVEKKVAELNGLVASLEMAINAPTVLSETATVAIESSAMPVDLEVNITAKAYEWTTVVLPFSMNEIQVKKAFGDDVKLAEFDGYDANYSQGDIVGINVNCKSANVLSIEANVPYIILPSQDVSKFAVNAQLKPSKAEVVVGNGKFVGSYISETIPADMLYINNGSKFEYSSEGTTMKAFRAYFDFDDVLADKSKAANNIHLLVDGVATLINSPEFIRDGEHVYDLNGMRVSKPAHGIYVKNGRKVVVK